MWAWFGRQDSSGKSNFSKTPRTKNQDYPRGVNALTRPTVGGIRRRDLVVCFDVGRVHQFFFLESLMYFLTCYRSALYLLNIKLLFRLTIVVLLDSCEFNMNVTAVRIYDCPPIA